MKLLELLLSLLMLISVQETSVLAQRSRCPKLSLPNGRVKIRARGKMAYFKCRKRFTRLGDRFAVCLQTLTWSHAVPLCIASGCPEIGAVPNMDITESYDGAMLKFTCAVGTKRKGPETLTCNSRVWSSPTPSCESGLTLACDFEEDLCGWSQDESDNFDWTRKSGPTPTMSTGPQGDHTTGSGYYMFIESSSPRKVGDVARMISPAYPPTLKNRCFEFWYNMLGPDDENAVGSLEVYIKPETALLEDIDPEFYMEGNQGPDWHRGFVKIPDQDENFKIIIVGTRKDAFVSDIAVDDLRLFNCSEETTTTSVPLTTAVNTTVSSMNATTPSFNTTVATSASAVTSTSRMISKTTSTSASVSTSTSSSKSVSASTSASTKVQKTTPVYTRRPTTRRRKTRPTSMVTEVTTPVKRRPRSTRPPTTLPSTTTTTKATLLTTTMRQYNNTTMRMRKTTPRKMRTTTKKRGRTRKPKKTTYAPALSTTPKRTKSRSSTIKTTLQQSTTPPSTTVYSAYNYSNLATDVMEISTQPTSERGDTVKVSKEQGTSTTATENVTSSTKSMSTDIGESATSVANTTDVITPTTEFSGTISTVRTLNTRSKGDNSTASYIPLVVGITAGITVGMIVIALLVWWWARRQRKKKEREAEEDEMYMIST